MVNTCRDNVGSTNNTVAPSEGTLDIAVSGQSGRRVLTENIDTRDGNLRRSRVNSDSNRSRSLSRNTTVNADSFGCKCIVASLIEINRDSVLVLTRNLNTILIPDVTGNLRINRSREGDLLSLTNGIGTGRHIEDSRKLMNDNRNLARERARTIRGVDSSNNMISSR